MLPILREIRAVAGVTGVAILIKHDGRMERFFPAAFTERHSEELQKLVTNAYQRLRGFSRLSLRFERVVVHLFNQSDFLLFATVLPDVEESIFESVVKSKIPAITRELARQAPARPATRSLTGKTLTAAPSAAPAGDVVGILLDAFSTVTNAMSPIFGAAQLANVWREARDRVTMENVAMAALEVDPLGRFSIRKGRKVDATADNVQSLARIWFMFTEAMGPSSPEADTAFYGVVHKYQQVLEYHGFFHFLISAAQGGPRRPVRTG